VKNSLHRPVNIVVRRLLTGSNPEVVELMPANSWSEDVLDTVNAVCRISSVTDGDTQIYSVSLPKGFVVRPVDWRRFAYNHDKVAELLSRCIQDNLLALDFVAFAVRPWSDEQRALAENTLTMALADLGSIFDTKSVRFEFHEDGTLLTVIEGEHKNGDHKLYCVSFQPLEL
jgi:hypothetical protein